MITDNGNKITWLGTIVGAALFAGFMASLGGMVTLLYWMGH